MFILFLLMSPLLLGAAPQKDRCPEVLKSAGASDSFGTNVGHAIHSITVRALKKFEPNVTEINRVPTINLNLSSADAILPYAPDRRGPSASMFVSEGMKTLDEVLSHMDDPNYDITFLSALEKVVHAFHMEEAWAMTKDAYDKLKKENPPSNATCECAMDVENNGVLKMLRFTALAIREPLLVYGNRLDDYKAEERDKREGYEFSYPIYTYHFMPENEWRKAGLTSEQMLMKREQAMARLTNAAAWEKWKMIGKMTMEEHKNVALFLYCALNSTK